MKDQIIKFWRDEEGATAIEYGLIAGLIAVAIVATVTNVGTGLSNLFKDIAEKLGFKATPTP
ncbi:Flp family type IVb pilin [Comamonas thiooxydans]|uniref:Flp family type IVb pilin n=1 Tax=Comamonas thiooxydans TaxID=363952 RepID=UPI00057B328C|nr:Flp family type IVb pilin [Comamonas thiooxydans]